MSVKLALLGRAHPEVTHPLNSLSVLYWHQGKYAEAEPLCLHVPVLFGHSGSEKYRDANALHSTGLDEDRFLVSEP